MSTDTVDPLHLPLLELIDSDGLPRTETHPCSYLPREAVTEGFRTPTLHGETYHDLMDRGFRRSGQIFYRPRCPSCQACIQMRIPVAEFEPSKSQRRSLAKNSEVRLRVDRLNLTREKIDLYARYLEHQHPGSPQSGDAEGLREFLYVNTVDTREVSYFADDRLIGVSILDICSRSVSTVYHFFDPDEAHRSLGVYSVLREIELTRRWNIPHYYMGFWVQGCAKMDYKARFRPHEVLIEGEWRSGE
ncbi:MAG: arginyltransferase [Phycisphaeraceae bacterium]